MPNDPRHYELPAPPELTADEVQDLGDRAAAELAEQKDAAIPCGDNSHNAAARKRFEPYQRIFIKGYGCSARLRCVGD